MRFTVVDIRNIADVDDPIFQRIRNLTVQKIFTPTTSATTSFMRNFDEELLRFLQLNFAGYL